ncbi:D-3-phosphoglycerate dehydrogenase-like [Corticium candelabrum]|uniref:D-3-phosphoglycerate dehydrogenase-like n=1 Tax=Corticium candelabrum TaxID=121492 RepID=UPI002E25BDF0|nr:D-3-phosphoglycerate dehydrogenase-like [Corticium candelabrum]
MALALQIEKVLVLDGVDASCTQLLESNGIKVDIRAKLSEEELVTSLGGYDAVVVRSATKVKGDVLHAGASGRLKLISRAGTGVDNIDVDAATRRGVLVMNAPGGNTFSAAEHACGLMLAVARNVAAADSSMKAGQWDRKKFAGCELDGKVLGVLGVGRIGQAVATRMQAFGMRTVGYDPVVPPSLMRENGVEPVDLEELWKVSDFITVHTPLLPSTKGMLGAEVIGKCKQGVRIINAARGGIVDEEALVSALESGHCGVLGSELSQCYNHSSKGSVVIIPVEAVSCTLSTGEKRQTALTCSDMSLRNSRTSGVVVYLQKGNADIITQKVANIAIVQEADPNRGIGFFVTGCNSVAVNKVSKHCVCKWQGAGLDVFEEEPPKNRKLIEHPRVTACPHLGASTPEAQKRCGQEIGEQIVSLVKGISAAGIVCVTDFNTSFYV